MEKMNTTKKIAIALAVIMVTAMAAPAVMAENDVPYSANVGPGQNTLLGVLGGDFGAVVSPSTGNHIDDTFKLNNTGNINATVKAKFTTNVSTTYGLVNSTNVIGGSNFSLRADDDSINTTLSDAGNDVTLSYEVPADGAWHNYDAWLDVPASMPDGEYAGTVRLTFSNAQ